MAPSRMSLLKKLFLSHYLDIFLYMAQHGHLIIQIVVAYCEAHVINDQD